MAYCTNCGKSIADEARFCRYCGEPVAQAPPPAAPEDTVVRGAAGGTSAPHVRANPPVATGATEQVTAPLPPVTPGHSPLVPPPAGESPWAYIPRPVDEMPQSPMQPPLPTAIRPPAPSGPPPQAPPEQPDGRPPRRGRAWLWSAVLAVLLVIVFCVLVFVVFEKDIFEGGSEGSTTTSQFASEGSATTTIAKCSLRDSKQRRMVQGGLLRSQ